MKYSLKELKKGLRIEPLELRQYIHAHVFYSREVKGWCVDIDDSFEQYDRYHKRAIIPFYIIVSKKEYKLHIRYMTKNHNIKYE